MDIEKEFDFSIIASQNSRLGGAHVGVKATHQPTGISVCATSCTTQYQNKLLAIKKVEEALTKLNRSSL